MALGLPARQSVGVTRGRVGAAVEGARAVRAVGTMWAGGSARQPPEHQQDEDSTGRVAPSTPVSVQSPGESVDD